jgi:nucleoside-diphosphate-sugar epimerase
MWKDKKVLITGGSGFVGSNALQHFSDLGSDVTVAVSPRNSSFISQHKNIRVVSSDLLIPSEAKKIVQGQNIILHFAAVDGNLEFKRNHSAEIFSKNMRINLNMFEAAASENVESFIFTSSSDIYSQTSENLLNEESPVDISFYSNTDGYKLAKWTSELASKEFIKQFNIPITILRPGNLYGPGDDFNENSKTRFIPSVITKISRHQEVTLWGDGTQTRSFLFINDFLFRVQKLIENKISNDIFNVASNQATSLQQIVEMVAQIFQVEPKLSIDTSKPGGAHSRNFDCSKLESAIGSFEEVPITDGLKQTIDFYTHLSSSHAY